MTNGFKTHQIMLITLPQNRVEDRNEAGRAQSRKLGLSENGEGSGDNVSICEWGKPWQDRRRHLQHGKNGWRSRDPKIVSGTTEGDPEGTRGAVGTGRSQIVGNDLCACTRCIFGRLEGFEGGELKENGFEQNLRFCQIYRSLVRNSAR